LSLEEHAQLAQPWSTTIEPVKDRQLAATAASLLLFSYHN